MLRVLVLFIFLQFALPHPKKVCDPIIEKCGENPALDGNFIYNFQRKGRTRAIVSSSSRSVTYHPRYGVKFVLDNEEKDVNLKSRFYIMYGKVTFFAKVFDSENVATTLGLKSDVDDEISFDFSTFEGHKALNTTTARRGKVSESVQVADCPKLQDTHIYTIEWKNSAIQWSIDGVVIRTLYANVDAEKYPQTPMYVRMASLYTGKQIDESVDALAVQSLRVENYSTGTKYEYQNQTGNLDSIRPCHGEISSDGPVLKTWFRNALLLSRPV